MLLSLFSLASCATITISTDRPWGDGDSERVLASTHAQVSALWGQNGELFEPGGRLPDFSYAGYRFGEASIPTYRTVASVEDYGANGRDQRDDTDAFVRALSSVQSGTIEIPEGQYFISGVVEISKPNLVLKGAGSDKTIITVTNTLDDVEPLTARTGSGKPVSRYSWSGGFFSVRGKPVGRKRFEIIRDARRGDRQVFVSNPAKFSPGDDVQIEMQGDPQGTLLSHLYSGQPGNTKNLKNNFTVRLYARVNSVNGQAVTLNRPLPWQIRSAWQPTLRVSMPSVYDSGIEGITIRFPSAPYEGHFTEVGRNAMAYVGTVNCWARDIVIENADSGIFFNGDQGTLDSITIRSSRSPSGRRTGHHGIALGNGNLLTNFRFETEFYHDITVTKLSAGNVIKNGGGINLSLDHHKGANHANLFCNLDVGQGSQIWTSGGAEALGRHAGAWSTYWAIRSDQPISYPPSKFGPDSINLVAVQTNQQSRTDRDGVWFEVFDPESFGPADLHDAQLRRRLGGP